MDPILFEIGPLTVRYYGLMYVVGIVVGTFLIQREVTRKGIGLTNDDVSNFVIWSVLSAILGARIYYVLFNWSYYSRYPLEIPAIWHGGLAIHGGLIGGTIAAYLMLKKKGIPFLKMADASAPAIVLGQAFGRFGNFMNGDAHGRPTDSPFGMVFPPESIAGREFPGIPLHPAMLYELAANLSIFLLLWFVFKGRDHKDGFIFALYIGLYSLGRVVVEHFRADSLMLGPLKAAQVVSLICIALAALYIVKGRMWKEGAGAG